MIAKFRKIMAGHYVNDESGVEIARMESGNWFVYTVVPGRQCNNLAASRNTLASAKVAATAVIAKLAARREADHAEALAEIEAEALIRQLLPTGITQIEQVDAWIERHGMIDPMGADLIEAREADHDEALEQNMTCRPAVTREDAFAAWGQVWAGRVPEGLSDAFRSGDYATAKSLADAAVAKQVELAERSVVITVPLTHASEVDRIRADWEDEEIRMGEALRRIMGVTGVTNDGAEDLLYAESTASLAGGC